MRAHTHTTLKAKDVRRQYMYIFNDLMKKRKKSQCNIIVHAESFLSLDFLFLSLRLTKEKRRRRREKERSTRISYHSIVIENCTCNLRFSIDSRKG